MNKTMVALLGMLLLVGELSAAPSGELVFTAEAKDKLGRTQRAVFSINADGSGRRQITKAGRIRTCSVSPVGRKIAYFKYPRVHVADWDGSNEVDITPVAREHFQPKWSPDGRQIAFTTDRNDNGEVYIMNFDGSDARNLTWQTMSSEMSPAWSPDGKQVAFISNRRGTFDVFVSDLMGFKQRLVTDGQGNCREPVWSPDGRTLAFSSDGSGNMDIWTVELATGTLQQVTQHPGWDGQPDWSPDGQYLSFLSSRSGNSDVHVIHLATKTVTNVTQSPDSDERFPVWVPAQIASEPLVVTKANISDSKLGRPRLLFTAEQLPGLREKLNREPFAGPWQVLQRQCDDLLLPDSKAAAAVEAEIAALADKKGIRQPAPKTLEATYKLGFAYQVTGDEKYGRKGAGWLAALSKQILLHLRQDKALAAYFRMSEEHLACSFDWLYPMFEASDLRASRNLLINSTGALYHESLRATLALGPASSDSEITGNITLIYASRLGVPALALAGEPGYDPNWLAASLRMLRKVVGGWFDENGGCACGPSYLAWAGEMGMPLMISCAINGIADDVLQGNINNWPQYLAMIGAHGGTHTVNINDHDGGVQRFPVGFLELYKDNPLVDFLWQVGHAHQNDRPAAKIHHLLYWRATKDDVKPASLLPRSMYFPYQGYAVLRSGFAEHDPMMTLTAHQYMGHTQAEAGSVLLYGYGRDWLIDAGNGNFADHAHNQLLVNGRGRAYPFDVISAPMVSVAASGQFAEAAHADYASAFEARLDGYLDYTIPTPWYPLKKASRTVAMVDNKDEIPPYFVIADDCERNGERNRYESMFTADRDLRVITGDREFTLEPMYSGPWLQRSMTHRANDGSVARFKVEIAKAGTYQLWVLSRSSGNKIKLNIGEQRVDGHVTIEWPRIHCWQWKPVRPNAKQPPLTVELAAGEHELALEPLMNYSVPVARMLLLPQGDWEPWDAEPVGMPQGGVLIDAENAKIDGPGWTLATSSNATLHSIRRTIPAQPNVRTTFSFLNPAPLQLEKSIYRFKTRFYGKNEVAVPRVTAIRETINPRFLVFAYPHAKNMSMPKIERDIKGQMIVGKIHWPKATDYVVSSQPGAPSAGGDIDTDAVLAVVREYHDSRVAHLIVNGTRLSFKGRALTATGEGMVSAVSSPE